MRFALVALAALLVLTGCSPEEADTAVVRGRLLVVGGPAGTSGQPLSGKVTLTSDDRTVTLLVGADGTWSAHVPPGQWTVSGYAPNVQGTLTPCGENPTRVVAIGGQATTHDVVCRRSR